MHTVVVDGSRIAVRNAVEIERDGRPVLRVEPLAAGALAVLALRGGWIDGRVIVGGLAVIERGTSALVRSGGRRVEIRWEPTREMRIAPAGLRCALCFGAIAEGEGTAVCACETAVH